MIILGVFIKRRQNLVEDLRHIEYVPNSSHKSGKSSTIAQQWKLKDQHNC